MTRATWRTITTSRNFYVQTYKRSLMALLFSVLINIVLGILIVYVYTGRVPPKYYASNGMTGPMELKPLDAPNDSPNPLLESEPEPVENTKLIPG